MFLLCKHVHQLTCVFNKLMMMFSWGGVVAWRLRAGYSYPCASVTKQYSSTGPGAVILCWEANRAWSLPPDLWPVTCGLTAQDQDQLRNARIK